VRFDPVLRERPSSTWDGPGNRLAHTGTKNGLGPPDRRWAPGTSRGPFCFSGEYFQAIAGDAVVIPLEELGLQHVPGTIALFWTQNMQANRSSREIGQLQSFGIGLLVGNQYAQRQGLVVAVGFGAHAPELQFERLVLLCASCFEDDAGLTVELLLDLEEMAHPFKAELHGEVIWVVRLIVAGLVLQLVDDDG